uniref:Uncharacterized protein n=1 Tax=Knipowitschia caucasica TaxID=637954 RepID=A0AAV2KQC9_KNICA
MDVWTVDCVAVGLTWAGRGQDVGRASRRIRAEAQRGGGTSSGPAEERALQSGHTHHRDPPENRPQSGKMQLPGRPGAPSPRRSRRRPRSGRTGCTYDVP